MNFGIDHHAVSQSHRRVSFHFPPSPSPVSSDQTLANAYTRTGGNRLYVAEGAYDLKTPLHEFRASMRPVET